MNRVIGALVLLSVSAGLLAEAKPVTLIVSDASGMTQGMAMVLANQMQEQGAQVDILLCDKAGDLGLKEAGGELLQPNDVTPAQLLAAALNKGATASVCALYLPNSGYAREALKDRVGVAAPDAMARSLLEDGRKVLGF